MFVKKLLLPTVLLAVLFGLTGCFKSSVPFIDEAEADFPFQTITYEFEGEDDQVTLIKIGNAYAAPDEQGDSTLLLKVLGNNLYVVQATIKEADSSYYLYALAKLSLDGKSAEILKPYAQKEDHDVAEQGKYGFKLCSDDDGVICLSNLQDYIDYALMPSQDETKRILILSLN